MATRVCRIIMVITVGAAPLQAQVMTWTSSRGPLTPAEAAAVLAPRATPPMWPVADMPLRPVSVSTGWRPGDGPFGRFPRYRLMSSSEGAQWVPIGPWWSGHYGLVGPSGVMGWSFPVSQRHRAAHLAPSPPRRTIRR